MPRGIIVLCACWISLLAAGCALTLPGAAPAQTTPVVLTAEPPLATPAATSEGWQSFTTPDEMLTLAHPPEWQLFAPADMTAPVDALSANAAADLAPVLDMIQSAPENLAAFAVIGVLPSSHNYTPTVTLMVMPAEPLSLDAYANLLEKQLNTLPYIEAESAEVVAGLRPQGLEVASIHYSVDGDMYQLDDQTLQGWQVALLDPTGESLVVITFTLPAADFTTIQPTLREFIHRIQF